MKVPMRTISDINGRDKTMRDITIEVLFDVSANSEVESKNRVFKTYLALLKDDVMVQNGIVYEDSPTYPKNSLTPYINQLQEEDRMLKTMRPLKSEYNTLKNIKYQKPEQFKLLIQPLEFDEIKIVIEAYKGAERNFTLKDLNKLTIKIYNSTKIKADIVLEYEIENFFDIELSGEVASILIKDGILKFKTFPAVCPLPGNEFLYSFYMKNTVK